MKGILQRILRKKQIARFIGPGYDEGPEYKICLINTLYDFMTGRTTCENEEINQFFQGPFRERVIEQLNSIVKKDKAYVHYSPMGHCLSIALKENIAVG